MRMFVMKNGDGQYYAGENTIAPAYLYDTKRGFRKLPHDANIGMLLKNRYDIKLLISISQVPDAMKDVMYSEFGDELEFYFDLGLASALSKSYSLKDRRLIK